jgi:dTDP-4-dehydrorhamnose reductase
MDNSADLVILGASGMLGQALACESRRRGIKTLGAGRSVADYRLDISDDAALAKLVSATRPKAIINAAAITDINSCEREPGRAYAVNARAVSILAELCTAYKVKLVQISTDHFFTGDGDRKHAEDAKVRLVNEYARGKYAAEYFALTCPGALVVRTNVVGFRGWQGQPTFVEWVLRSLKTGEAITIFSDFHTSSIDGKHLASAILDLLFRQAAGLFNVASREVTSKKVFIEALANAAQLSLAHATTGSVKSINGARRAESAGLDVARAEEFLGYRLPTMSEVIEALVSEFRDRESMAQAK